MSTATLFCLVEGPADRNFYGQMADRECRLLNNSYVLASADEIQGGEGGKQVLLQFFSFLRCRNSLLDEFKGKKTAAVFFLDRDVDNGHTMRRSAHVVYTETYEYENYLYVYGDLGQAAGIAAQLDPSSVRKGLGDYSLWRNTAAAKWKDWVKLCFFSHTRLRPPGKYYSRPSSQINEHPYGPVDHHKLSKHMGLLEQDSGLPSRKFKRAFRRLSDKVESLYSCGKEDLVFKGTWYSSFLVADIDRIAGKRHIGRKALREKLLTALASSLDYDSEWAEHFRGPIRVALRRLLA